MLRGWARKLNGLIAHPRWMPLIINAAILGFVTFGATTAFIGKNLLLFGMDCLCVGLLIGSSFYMFFAPSIMERIAESEMLMMQAQIEKGMNDAMRKFAEAHPELGLQWRKEQ